MRRSISVRRTGRRAVRLRTIHRHIGAFEQLIRIDAVIGRNCDADARGHGRLLAAELVGLAERLDDAGRERRRRLRLLAAELQNRELVTAEARDHALRFAVSLHAAAKPLANLAQKLITGRMAKGVIHVLEAIQVEAQEGELLLRLCTRDPLRQIAVEQQAIGQIGQCVMLGHMRDADFRIAAIGDVFIGCDPPARRHGAKDHRDGPAVGKLAAEAHKLRNARLRSKDRQQFVARRARMIAEAHAVVPQLKQRYAGLCDLREKPNISMKRSLNRITRKSASNRQSPCDMLLSAASR